MSDDERDERADGAGAGEDGAKVYVCSLLDDDGNVCGETFTGERASIDKANHTRSAHPNHRNPDRKRAPRARQPKTDKPPTQPRAPRPPKGPSRAEQYQNGLVTLATLAAILPGPFDAFDCQCVTNGAAMVAPPLADIAEQNDAVRKALDSVLGGGPAGPYVTLVMACMAIGAPIAAHHGLIPTSAGNGMGAMIGVTVPAPPAPPVDASPSPSTEAPAGAGIDPNNVEDVAAFLAQVPVHVAVDAAQRMAPPPPMGEDRPVVVLAPTIATDADTTAAPVAS